MEQTKRFKLFFVLVSIAYILLGVLRLLTPNPDEVFICYVLGGALLLAGIIRVSLYFARRDEQRVFRSDLATGVMLLIGGVYVLIRPEEIITLLPIILGFGVLYDSILKLQYSFELKRTTLRAWWVIMVLAVLTTIAAVLLIMADFDSAFMIYFLGIVLIFDGVVNLIALLMVSLQMRKSDKDSREIEAAFSGTSMEEDADTEPEETPTEQSTAQ